jgi:WD40 repeat protein
MLQSFEHAYEPDSVVFSPDGLWLARSDGWEVIIQKVKSGKPQQRFKATGHIRAVSLSEQRLAESGCGVVWAWDREKGSLLWEGRQSDNSRFSNRAVVDFSRNGERIATNDEDSVFIWDAATGEVLQRIDARLQFISFGSEVNYLNCEPGCIALDGYGSASFKKYRGLGMDVEGSWITRDGKNHCWIPNEHGADVCTSHEGQIAIGCRSGYVLLIRD